MRPRPPRSTSIRRWSCGGVSLNDLEQGARARFRQELGLLQEEQQDRRIFIAVGLCLAVIIVGLPALSPTRSCAASPSLLLQPAGHVRGGVSDQNIRAGAAHGQQAFQRHRALVNPAVGAQRLSPSSTRALTA